MAGHQRSGGHPSKVLMVQQVRRDLAHSALAWADAAAQAVVARAGRQALTTGARCVFTARLLECSLGEV